MAKQLQSLKKTYLQEKLNPQLLNLRGFQNSTTEKFNGPKADEALVCAG